MTFLFHRLRYFLRVQNLLNNEGCQAKRVKRCYHRVSGKPMPIVKIHFDNPDSLQHSLNLQLSIFYNKRKAFVEKRSPKKIIRCFNCMKYGHISVNCSLETVCENCGGKDHSSKDCANKQNCANCSGAHPASSSKCPIFQEKVNQLRIQKLM